MKFSIINVTQEKNGKIDGYWLQDHIGTLESAKRKAAEISAANEYKLDIAITAEIPYQDPANYLRNLVRLNTPSDDKEAMTTHTYYMTQRPPSLGCQPMDGMLEVKDYGERKTITEGIRAWGDVTYSRQLTEKEIADYELAPQPTNK